MISRLTTIVALFACSCLAETVQAQCSIEWKEPVSGDWRDAENWEPSGPPGPIDVVCITKPGSYDVHFNPLPGENVVAGLIVGGGGAEVSLSVPTNFVLVLTGAGQVNPGAELILVHDAPIIGGILEVHEQVVILGELIVDASGGIRGSGGVTIGASGYMRVVSGAVTLDGASLTNIGHLLFAPDPPSANCGGMRIQNGGHFENLGTTFIAGDDCGFSAGPGAGSIDNNGLIHAEAATSGAFIHVPMTNTGTLSSDSGSFRIGASSTHVGATFEVTGDLHFGGLGTTTDAVHIMSGVESHGSGSIVIEGGILVDVQGAVDIFSNLQMQSTAGFGDTRLVAGAPVHMHGEVNWISGRIAGSESVRIMSAATLHMPGETLGNRILDGHELINEGQVRATGGSIRFENGGKIRNRALLGLEGGSLGAPGQNGSIVNELAGVIRAQGATGTIGVPIESAGYIETVSGLLTLTGETTHVTGAVLRAATGGELRLQSPSNSTVRHFVEDATVDGSGIVTIAAGASHTTILDLTGPLVVEGTLVLVDNNSRIEGPGALLVTGTLRGTRGVVSGSGPVTIAGSLEVPSGTMTLNGRTMTNVGTATFAGNSFIFQNGSTFINETGGLFDIQSNGSLTGGQNGLFQNRGILAKSAGGATSSVGVAFESTGSIVVTSGVLRFPDGLHNGVGGTVSGTGTVHMGGATLVNGGTVSPGESPGSLTIQGSFVDADGAVEIEIEEATGPGVGFDELVVTGTVALGGALRVSVGTNYVPDSTLSFVVLRCTGSATCLSGTFESVDAPDGLSVAVEYGPSSVSLALAGTTSAEPTPGGPDSGIPASELDRISAAHPNPSSHTATATIAVGQSQEVVVSLYDALGRAVTVIYQGPMAAGVRHRLEIPSGRLAAGVYFLHARGASFSSAVRLVVQR